MFSHFILHCTVPEAVPLQDGSFAAIAEEPFHWHVGLFAAGLSYLV